MQIFSKVSALDRQYSGKAHEPSVESGVVHANDRIARATCAPHQVVFITRLRLTDLPIRDIQAYFRLVAEGSHTEPQRLAVLERHRDHVKARLAELQTAVEAVEFKIAVYGGSCAP